MKLFLLVCIQAIRSPIRYNTPSSFLFLTELTINRTSSDCFDIFVHRSRHSGRISYIMIKDIYAGLGNAPFMSKVHATGICWGKVNIAQTSTLKLNLYMLGIFFFHEFFSSIFFKIFIFFQKNFSGTLIVTQFGSRSCQHYVGPYLGPNCLQKYKQTTAAFHQGLYYLFMILRERKKMEVLTCDP